jgi:hypothetical protein
MFLPGAFGGWETAAPFGCGCRGMNVGRALYYD